MHAVSKLYARVLVSSSLAFFFTASPSSPGTSPSGLSSSPKRAPSFQTRRPPKYFCRARPLPTLVGNRSRLFKIFEPPPQANRDAGKDCPNTSADNTARVDRVHDRLEVRLCSACPILTSVRSLVPLILPPTSFSFAIAILQELPPYMLGHEMGRFNTRPSRQTSFVLRSRADHLADCSCGFGHPVLGPLRDGVVFLITDAGFCSCVLCRHS
ncbi:hypothetical protein EVG20_g11105 [Dentipellis fragilis]|uniref:Secreted protein n=1 Tax=Dentipellis fragilis TaxID=205917 RepID=A0A4Y9XN89_9AGAM|nr:hypothetical protein EVG20_g11105 [Dentipellis fragilis]